jgi:hypothetical protein
LKKSSKFVTLFVLFLLSATIEHYEAHRKKKTNSSQLSTMLPMILFLINYLTACLVLPFWVSLTRVGLGFTSPSPFPDPDMVQYPSRSPSLSPPFHSAKRLACIKRPTPNYDTFHGTSNTYIYT